jgi:hypothetical protein
VTFTGGTIQENTFQVAANEPAPPPAPPGDGYDVVIDVNGDGLPSDSDMGRLSRRRGLLRREGHGRRDRC